MALEITPEDSEAWVGWEVAVLDLRSHKPSNRAQNRGAEPRHGALTVLGAWLTHSQVSGS